MCGELHSVLERNLTVQNKVTQFSCKTQIHTGLTSDGLEDVEVRHRTLLSLWMSAFDLRPLGSSVRLKVVCQ